MLEHVMPDPGTSITQDRRKNEEPHREKKREGDVDEHEARTNDMKKAASVC